MSEHENEPGGPHYGGVRGGESAGSSGGQGGKGEAAGESGEPPDAQSGQSGGRGPTERDGEPTAESENSDGSPPKSSADRGEEKQHEMEESGEESPG